MIYAQIKNSKIENVIVIDEGIDTIPFKTGFDDLIDITQLDPVPVIGDFYDNNKFSSNENS